MTPPAAGRAAPAISVPDGLIRPRVRLAGEDGNAHAIMNRVSAALIRAGNPRPAADSYRRQAVAGDYRHLLAVSLAFVELLPPLTCPACSQDQSGCACED